MEKEYPKIIRKRSNGTVRLQIKEMLWLSTTLENRYYNGEGVPQDYKEAVKWQRKAAEQGYANDQ
jgi:hypothetical protein